MNAMSDLTQPLFTRRTLLASLGLALLFLVILFLEGRPVWCKYGVGVLTAARTHCTSQHLLDPYTLSHVLHGILFYWMLRPFAHKITLPWRQVTALGLEIGWEVLENSPWVIERYRQQTASLDYTGDSVLNSIGDLLATAVGFAFASQFSWKVAVAVFVVVEVALAIFIRDNLTLNVLMLFVPIEAVKQWQIGMS
jgi:Protein of unknown function (DUF2585)